MMTGQKWKFPLWPINLPIDKYVFDKKQVPFWKFCQCTYHLLYKTENESDICVLIWVEEGVKHIIHNLCTL